MVSHRSEQADLPSLEVAKLTFQVPHIGADDALSCANLANGGEPIPIVAVPLALGVVELEIGRAHV